MSDADKFLNKIVVARCADGSFNFVGHCISYCDAPTVGINLPEGTHGNWRADLCQVIDMPEEALPAMMENWRRQP